jgi:hypothetical protein
MAVEKGVKFPDVLKVLKVQRISVLRMEDPKDAQR